jgi:hypothetical protein
MLEAKADQTQANARVDVQTPASGAPADELCNGGYSSGRNGNTDCSRQITEHH